MALSYMLEARQILAATTSQAQWVSVYQRFSELNRRIIKQKSTWQRAISNCLLTTLERKSLRKTNIHVKLVFTTD